MDNNNLDNLRFESDDERRKYLADLARLKRIREESRMKALERAYQTDSEFYYDDDDFEEISLVDTEVHDVSYDIPVQKNIKPNTSGSRKEKSADNTYIFTDTQPYKKEQKKKSKWWVWLVAAMLLILVAFPVYGMFFSENATGKYTIAVFGLDSRDGNTEAGALSDVNMIVQIDQDTAEIKLVSIYRDTYVQISEDEVYHKFNQAYHRGGHEQALWTLEHNTDIKADDYAAFNWKAVVEGINLLGGIDLEITDKEFQYINGFITETVNSTGIGSVQLKAPGMQHLDGVQAVAYARLRLMDNDFKRTERQRKVISLCLEKAKQADLETLITIAEAILPQINTSMDMTDLLPLLRNMDDYKIVASKGWPFENVAKKVKSRGSCVIPATLESNVIELHQFLNPQPEAYKPSEGVIKSSQHIEQLTGVHQIAPQPTAEEVAAAAAEVVTEATGNAESESVTETPAN